MENTATKSKNVYLIVSDLHDTCIKKQNRFDYKGEIKIVYNKIIELIQKYSESGFSVSIMFLGDVFDKGFADTFDGIEANNVFMYLRTQCEQMYSVVGNHELSFYANNPFYTLVSEIESERMQQVKSKTWTPRGVLPILRVPDCVEDGEVVFHFNHFNTGISRPIEGKINVGLFHQDLVCQEILDQMQEQLQTDKLWGTRSIDFNKVSFFKGYDYCFMGHLHKVYGTWRWVDDVTNEASYLYYLASLGRPNYTEVNDAMLERNIPAVVVEDGHLSEVQDNKFILPKLEESVNLSIVESRRKQYEVQKARKQMRLYDPMSDEPIKNILMKCLNEEQRVIFAEFVKNGMCSVETELVAEVNSYLSK